MSSQIVETMAPPRPAIAGDASQWRAIKVVLAFGDTLSVALGFYLAYILRFWSNWPIFREGFSQPQFYLSLMLVLVPCWLAIFWAYGLYNHHKIFGGTQEYALAFNACTLGMILVIVLTFLVPDVIVARAWLLLAWAFSLGLTLIWRFSARRIVYAMRQRGLLLERVLVLGANAEGRAIASQLCQWPGAGVQIVGFVDDDQAAGTEVLPGVPILGSVVNFQQMVAQHEVDTVIIADTSLVRERLPTIYGAMETLYQLNVRLSPGLFELLTIGVQVREQGSVPLLNLNKTRITGLHAISKGVMDRAGALAALILLSPVLVAVAILVRLDSPGPIIHRRRVIGVGNKAFDAFKFRTMYTSGESLLSAEQREELHEQGKLQDDPRVTRIGRFLRRMSIDELPQLVNVLFGQMSLVGPRMITSEELRHFGRWRHNLVTVRPGLTGLWQISGRSNLGYEERVRLDMHYIRNYTIWLDLYIIYRTVSVVLSGKGAF